MAVGIESETTTEARLLREVLVGYAVEVVEEPLVRFLQLPQDLGERQVPFLFLYWLFGTSVPPTGEQGRD